MWSTTNQWSIPPSRRQFLYWRNKNTRFTSVLEIMQGLLWHLCFMPPLVSGQTMAQDVYFWPERSVVMWFAAFWSPVSLFWHFSTRVTPRKSDRGNQQRRIWSPNLVGRNSRCPKLHAVRLHGRIWKVCRSVFWRKCFCLALQCWLEHETGMTFAKFWNHVCSFSACLLNSVALKKACVCLTIVRFTPGWLKWCWGVRKFNTRQFRLQER